MTPARPRPLTTNHDAKNCVSSTKLGAGRRWTASLLTTSISEEQAMYPRVTAAVELELLGLSMLALDRAGVGRNHSLAHGGFLSRTALRLSRLTMVARQNGARAVRRERWAQSHRQEGRRLASTHRVVAVRWERERDFRRELVFVFVVCRWCPVRASRRSTNAPGDHPRAAESASGLASLSFRHSWHPMRYVGLYTLFFILFILFRSDFQPEYKEYSRI